MTLHNKYKKYQEIRINMWQAVMSYAWFRYYLYKWCTIEDIALKETRATKWLEFTKEDLDYILETNYIYNKELLQRGYDRALKWKMLMEMCFFYKIKFKRDYE